jgi:hypothetical protein
MKRTALIIAMTMLVSVSIARAQESVTPAPVSPVKGGKVTKAMTAEGVVKTVTADSLAINDGPGKDWTFVIDTKTKFLPREGVVTTPVSPVEGGKVIPGKALKITDVKEGLRVQVRYHTVNGKMHATQVQLM